MKYQVATQFATSDYYSYYQRMTNKLYELYQLNYVS